MAAGNQQNICFLVFLLMREFFTVGTHKVYSNIYSETRNVKIAKSPKIGSVFNPHYIRAFLAISWFETLTFVSFY